MMLVNVLLDLEIELTRGVPYSSVVQVQSERGLPSLVLALYVESAPLQVWHLGSKQKRGRETIRPWVSPDTLV